MQEVRSRTVCALQEIVKAMAGLFCDIQQVNCPHTGGKQGLMGIAPGCVHKKTALVIANSLSERFGSLLVKKVLPALLAGLVDVNLLASIVKEFGMDDVALELRLAHLAFDAASVDSEVTQVG